MEILRIRDLTDEFVGENFAMCESFLLPVPVTYPLHPFWISSWDGCCLLLDRTMGRIGRIGRMIMGQEDEGTNLWETMGLWDGSTHPGVECATF